ncbi:TetR/AcrR family transcriptional regulator [Rhodococcus phenolicus]|uniref:TetR/AcrR family transcriptional regulator n=1 Tax=Rhodococcus phenolicus TaxID=263849 RepID=UPI000831CE87|nr:TetR/AcrR family transcriptional regulator [Rhodococcus phenolicus]
MTVSTRGESNIGRNPRVGKPGPAERLLETASALFSEHGIRAVGIDRILAESGVARASLYSAYGSKDALVVAYLDRLDRRDRARWVDAVAGMQDPAAKILAFFDLALASAPSKGYRGCQYSNAATEFPDESFAPVVAHREWLRGTLVELLTAAGVAEPDAVALRIRLIYDGAFAGSKLERTDSPLRRGREMVAELIGG